MYAFTSTVRGISGFCALALALLVASCGGGGGGGGSSGGTPAPTYTIGGTVTGLSGTGLVLQDGADTLAIPVSGPYTSATSFPSGTAYNIQVKTQPTNPSQTCTVTNGSGTVGSANVTNVSVNCVTNTYTISGTVSGLAGSGLVLQDNGGDNKAISADGAFSFATPVASGAAYAVTVLTPPSNLSQTCSVTNGSGTVSGANVSNVSISCSTNSFIVGGVVSGHNGTGLTLRVTTASGTSNLFVPGNGSYAFPGLVDGTAYTVSVFSQPIQQVCTLANPSGTLAGANVANVAVTCTTNTYTIGGTVGGLAFSGLVLRNNGGNNLAVSLNGAFTFSTPIASGSPYNVTIFAQPTNQTCAVSNASGTVGSANVTNVTVTCVTNASTIGGTVFVTGGGALGSGLVLQDNLGDNLPISAKGTFTFSTPVAIGQPYSVTVLNPPSGPTQTCVVTNGSGTVPITPVTNVAVTCTTNTYTIGGSITGLTGAGLVLQNNGGNNLTVPANATSFTFSTQIASGAAYAVTVSTPPNTPTQTCSVASGTGTVGGANVTTVAINCTTNTYTIGGSITGLTGTGLVLQNNGGNNLTVPANATSFTFATPILSGATYAVTASAQPSSPTQTCSVTSGGTGTVGGANVTTVAINCATNTYTIGGSITGLTGTGLVLRNTYGLGTITSDLTVPANATSFTFAASVSSSDTYSVSVPTQPGSPTQTCSVTSGGTGTVGGANVTTVAINCTTNTYTIGGSITGLTGTGLILRNNGGNDLTVAANATSFAFTTPIASGAAYAVTVLTQPSTPTQNCVVTAGSGTVGGANVTSVSIACTTSTFTIGGTITGLTGTGLVLRNNGGNDLVVAASATAFTFTAPIASGAAYAVTVFTQPATPTQSCVVTNGTGTVGSAIVTNVSIACTTSTFTIGGTITGLTGTGLVLRNNGGNDLTVAANATAFTFSTPIASGAAYAVTVSTQPNTPTQNCVVTAGSGTVTNANVTTVSIACTTSSFTIGGTVTGLAGTGLVLRNNGGDSKTISANGAFAFATPVLSGAAYAVTVFTQPTILSQTCTVTQGTGTVAGANVTNVTVTCVTPGPRFAYVANFFDNSVSIYTVNAITGQLRLKDYVPSGTNPITVSIDPSGKFAYVPNNGSNSVSAYTIDSGSGLLTQINCGGGVGCSGANFAAGAGTYSVTVDPSGKFAYAANADGNSASAYTINSGTGALTQINCGGGAGCTGANFTTGTSPRSVAVDPSGKFAYVANHGDGVTGNTVSGYTINGDGSLTSVGAQVAAGPTPRSLTIDPSGKFVYVANDGNPASVSAYTITAVTGVLVAVGGSPFALTDPQSHPLWVTVDPSGRFVYTANASTDNVSAFIINGTTGALGSLTTVSAGVSGSSPVAVTVDSTGTLAYVSNGGSNNIVAYNIDPTTGALTALSSVAGRSSNEGMAITKGTAVVYTPKFAYVANSGGDVSGFTINAGTGVLTSVGAAAGAGTTPASVAVDPSGKFAYVANSGSANVSGYTINAGTGVLASVGAAAGAGTTPASVAVDPSGQFAYVANAGSASVSAYTIDSGSGVLTQINCGGGAGCVGADFAAGTTPQSVTVDPSGRFAYVANAGSASVSVYTINATTGALTQIDADAVTAGIQNFAAGTTPKSIAVAASGRFAYVANAGDGTVSGYRIDVGTAGNVPTGGLTALLTSPFSAGTNPVSITAHPAGQFAYVVNNSGVQQFSIDATSGALTAVGSPVAAGTTPVSINVDPSGKFAYVANAGGGVSRFTIDAVTGALSLAGTTSAGTGPSSVTTTGTSQ